MKNNKLIVRTKSKIYPIYFGNNILGKTGKFIKKNLPDVRKICIISDNKLPKILLKRLVSSLKNYDIKIYKLSVSEKVKNLNVANKITEQLLKDNFNRSDCIISLGGGIVSDLAAFISSITKRGIGLVNIPTTLLAQSDASIGGKTGVNSNQGKNLIGTFYQPDFVLSDMYTLDSLPYKEMICGYAEILKHSLILDKNFFSWLSKNANKIINKDKNILKKAVIKSCQIKSQIISKDENEKNLRMLLNFGHTFAHSFEAVKNFSKKISHGESVLLGMNLANHLAYNKKILPLKDLILIKKHYFSLNLPIRISQFFKKKEINKIVYFMKKDKKNFRKKINLILLKKIGKTIRPNSFNIESSELKKFLSDIYS